MIICDTSILAKYYVQELDSAVVRTRLDAEDFVYASEFTRPELMSVFHRHIREKRLDRSTFTTLISQFQKDEINGYWTWIPLDSSILEQVTTTYATLPETVFLRTADCIHLVTALHAGFTELYTQDVHQLRAAPALGLKAITID